jgi:hypothetical protein
MSFMTQFLVVIGLFINVVLLIATFRIIWWIRDYLNRVDERAQRAEDREVLALMKKEKEE